MLAAAQRLRRREDFAATIRNGRRAGRGALVVHFLQSTVEPAPADQPSARAGFVVSASGSPSDVAASSDVAAPVSDVAGEAGAVPARAGFVVSKAVGNAVVRNLVKRRLRHLIRPHLAALPPASTIVVRALPASANARYDDLGRDLEAALTAAQRPRSREGRR
ncbi:ribonuclease P protein component [Dactylosporangium aurantiacum]|uniref:Ribonuclease P protein component n=1 Tax=Dactylosporangium aurantiacum TaxID=35754 RepID=A0A9Q9MJI4_9ACTN|nr:ribonuclease P protein component [Dactylosporangium aurantiacum]MDG6101252.1 ribonuclease P protein component [Dactylosporangium aurantiacum]UWZ54731.1 ribonuclease P protein component [Dactylosporangium aurantiacum]